MSEQKTTQELRDRSVMSTEPTTLDDIIAGKDTTMTDGLIRLFKAAGCSPTVCHACQKTIKAGAVFRLVPHRVSEAAPLTDEMCCAKHGEADLVKRDKRAERRLSRPAIWNWNRVSQRGSVGMAGYTRPSKGQS